MHGRINRVFIALCLLPLGCRQTNPLQTQPADARPATETSAVSARHHDTAIAELYDALRATRQAIQITAHNLANAETFGYKAGVARFTNNGTEVRTVNDFATGPPRLTGGDFDLMIDGEGFFRVSLREDPGGIAYTRAGNFFRNIDGDLVLGNPDGPKLEPGLNIPGGTRHISISPDGEVSGMTMGSVSPTIFGRIELAAFTEPRGLERVSDILFIETPDSGMPIMGGPGEYAFGTLLHKFLEGSNADTETELATLTSLNWRHEDLRQATSILSGTPAPR